MAESLDFAKGGLDRRILEVLASSGPTHGHGIVRRLEQATGAIGVKNVAAIYPILYRLQARRLLVATRALTDKNREAKFFALSDLGEKYVANPRDLRVRFLVALWLLADVAFMSPRSIVRELTRR